MSLRLKLQNFAPDGSPAAARPAAELERQLRAARDAGYAAGVQDGAEASAREHAEAQDQLRAGFVEALRDAALARDEMQTAVLQSVFPLLDGLIRHLVPGLAATGFREELRRHLDRALAARPRPVPRLHCAPDLTAGIKAALIRYDGEVELVPDPRLSPLEAELHWADGFDRIDVTTALAAVDAALAAERDRLFPGVDPAAGPGAGAGAASDTGAPGDALAPVDPAPIPESKDGTHDR